MADVALGIKVRCLQQKCKLSNLQARHVTTFVSEHYGDEADLSGADRELREKSGVEKVILHGCIGVANDGQACQHVYGPGDARNRCPTCGHSRYKANGITANEIVYHFPIKKRLQALLSLPNFKKLLMVCSHMRYVCV